MDKLAKNAPAGSESAVAAWKAFVKTASDTYEAANNATKHVVEAAESNVGAASSASARRTRQAVVPGNAVEK